MDISKLIVDCEKMVKDGMVLVEDIEQVVADFKVASAGPYEKNGEIIKRLIEGLAALAQNPAVQQIILALISSFLKKQEKHE